jgi:hypothetical protein
MYELNEEDQYYADKIEANRDAAYPYYLRIRANPLDMIYIPCDVIRMEVINHFNIKYATPPAWLYLPTFPYGYAPDTTDTPENSVD